MRQVLGAVVAIFCISVSAAKADCAYGNMSLGGAIGAYGTDNSRSFTIAGRAVLSVAGAVDYFGNPANLRVTFDNYCRTRVGTTISCTVNANSDVYVRIENMTGNPVTYHWVCSGL